MASRISADLIDISQRFIVLDQHFGEGRAALRVRAHNLAQNEDVVGSVADLLGVEDNLRKLVGLRKALDDFGRHTGPKVDGQGHGSVVRLHQISQLFTALQLQNQKLQNLFHTQSFDCPKTNQKPIRNPSKTHQKS